MSVCWDNPDYACFLLLFFIMFPFNVMYPDLDNKLNGHPTKKGIGGILCL